MHGIAPLDRSTGRFPRRPRNVFHRKVHSRRASAERQRSLACPGNSNQAVDRRNPVAASLRNVPQTIVWQFHIGANPTSSMAEYEDVFIRLRCRTKFYLPDEIVSKQPMSSLFEQSLLLLLDSVAMNIIERQEITDLHTLWKYHANLE